MNFFQKLRGRLAQSSQYNVNTPQNQFFNQWTDNGSSEPFNENYQYRNQSFDDCYNTAGQYRPSDENYQYQNQIEHQWTNSAGLYQSFEDNYQYSSRTRAHETYYDDEINIASLYQSFDDDSQNASRKRQRENYCDDDYNDSLSHIKKKQRLNVPCIQYAIKQPSQYTHPLRKILENLFYTEITADGWEKNNDGFKYHTRIRGNCFYQFGNTIDDAKELVAERALQEFCNFKYEKIAWPHQLLPYRLNQDFADEIERFVRF